MNHVSSGLPREHLQRLLAAHPRRRGQSGRIETRQLAVQRVCRSRAARRDRTVRVRTLPQLARFRFAVAHDNHRHGVKRALLHPINE